MNLAVNNPIIAQNNSEPQIFVIHYPDMAKTDEEAVIRFFKDLAPENKSNIDLPLIIDEGFPVFEKVLGTSKWNKLKKHYCIGFKRASVLKIHDLNSLLSELRTVENAKYYLHGYSELLEKVSKKLTNYPDNMDTVTKCKVLFMYALVFRNCFYFSEDENLSARYPISPEFMSVTNNRLILPEELKYVYKAILEKLPDENVMYDRLFEELMVFSPRDRKDILSTFELRMENGNIISSNTGKERSFNALRRLKYSIFPEPEMIAMDLYFLKDWQQKTDFSEIYKIYKAVTTKPLESFNSVVVRQWYVTGSVIRQKEFIAYKCGDVLMVSDQTEADRIVRFVEYCIKNNVKLPVEIAFIDGNAEITPEVLDKAEKETTSVNVAEFFAFLDFARELGYIDNETDISTDFMRYFVFLNLENSIPLLKDYIEGSLTAKDLRNKLGITPKFEKDEFGLEVKVDPLEVLKDFAVEQGYVSSAEDVSCKLVSEILVQGNEELIESYAKGELSSQKFTSKLKIEPELASMYFSLANVDSTALENALLDIKSSRSSDLTKHALTVKLYCYLIDNQVKCGKKPRVLKGNKRLKLSNLKALAQIA